jgi:hypothetical protein
MSAANTSSECYTPLGLCRLRAARLKAGGGFYPAPHNVYVSDALIDAQPKRNVTKGDNFTQKDGCGKVRATFQGCDSLDSIDLTLNTITWEPSLFEMLTGGTLYTSGGKVVGYAEPSISVGCPNGVGLELWTRAWNVDQQAVDLTTGDPVWIRVGFAKAVFQPSDYNLGNDITKTPLIGHCTANSQFAHGPYADWPGLIPGISGWFYDNAIPTASCGYLSRTES